MSTSKRRVARYVIAYEIGLVGHTIEPVRGKWSRHALPRFRTTDGREVIQAYPTEVEAIRAVLVQVDAIERSQQEMVALYQREAAEWAEKRAELEARAKELEKR